MMGGGHDAIVVGAGPNGLAAAITLAREGRRVLVREAAPTIGGGSRTAELTLPGFQHDICAAIHPLGVASPFFQTVPLEKYGLEWVYPEAALAHPFDDGTAALLTRSVEETARTLAMDVTAYQRVMGPLTRGWDQVVNTILGPLRFPRHPLAAARFGLSALQPAEWFAKRAFEGPRARGIFAGMAAHAIMPLDWPATASFGLVLAMLGHIIGWPMARGGSQSIVNAMAAHLRDLGGEIVTDAVVTAIDELPPARAVIFDVTPRQLLAIAGDRLPAKYRAQLTRYRYGPGVHKVDWALDGPVPWRADVCRLAGTVHVGGTMTEIAGAMREVWAGRHPERPFLLTAQQSLFDPTRAPAGRHTFWAYCHVPNGSTVDMTERMERQIERFAPGFRDRILARHVMTAADINAYNANYIGGDINGGVQDLMQLFTRPAPRLVPYKTPTRGIYLCSSSTPPGGGVHGMGGYWAARVALADELR